MLFVVKGMELGERTLRPWGRSRGVVCGLQSGWLAFDVTPEHCETHVVVQ